MDWLDEKIDNLKNHQQSLQGSLGVYIFFGVVAAVFASAFLNILCIGWERFLLGIEDEMFPWKLLLWQEPEEIPVKLEGAIALFRFVRLSSVVVFVALGIVLVTRSFYRRKIQQPILILQDEIEAIKADDLSRPMYYKSGDEFEEVFHAFEEMRRHLVESRTQILQLNDEQRKVNAAFSHDIRTPLSVIQNNAELIETFYPTGQLSEEMLQKSLDKIKHNVSRLNDFSKTMQEIQKVDEINLVKEYQSLEKVVLTIRSIADSLVPGKFHLKTEGNFVKKSSYDLQIITEVAENLLSNAKRFANEEVKVTLLQKQNFLYLYVQDDGPGFTEEELSQATCAYYSGDKSNHFGLGLTISDALARKHGGKLQLDNGVNGGAIVTVVFSL